ncbi:DNA replication complex GINS family protein [Candidatus Pacearchaeota archaeon]|nr:DNA replication complex GINS family protein [Candidatus Pacearchaeota archaeon]
MITYNEIYEAVRKERAEELQPLPKNFLDEVSVYLKEKKEFSSKNIDDFSDSAMKAKKQLENARTLFKELILRRRKKILNLLLIATETGISKKDSENMLEFEKTMFENLMKSVDSTESQVNSLFNVKTEERIVSGKTIAFKEDVDEFFDMEGKLIGPFKKGEKAELDEEIAKILVESEKAERL